MGVPQIFSINGRKWSSASIGSCFLQYSSIWIVRTLLSINRPEILEIPDQGHFSINSSSSSWYSPYTKVYILGWKRRKGFIFVLRMWFCFYFSLFLRVSLNYLPPEGEQKLEVGQPSQNRSKPSLVSSSFCGMKRVWRSCSKWLSFIFLRISGTDEA